MDRKRRLTALSHSVHDRSRSGLRVSTNKQFGIHCRLKRSRINLQLFSAVLRRYSQFSRSLANGDNNAIGFEPKAAVLIEGRTKSALRIKHRQTFGYLQTDSAVIGLNEPSGAPAVFDLDALFDGFFKLRLKCRHFIALLKANDFNIRYAHFHAGQGGIHSNISAADDDNVLADGSRLSFLNTFQKIEALPNAWKIFPFDL